jgi:leader peptidase (prepilin peptidase)/N-methyltransferase
MTPAQVAVLTVFGTLAGASVGSFVNVLIYRLPRERSAVAPRSHCFCCGTELSGRDLVPIFSYLLGGRRCRYCGVALSGQYVWVEAVTAVLFGLFVWRFGVGLATLAYLVATAVMLAAFVTDLRYKIIPTQLNTVLAVTAFGCSLLSSRIDGAAGVGKLPTPGMALLGALVGYGVFELIVRFGRRLFGQEAMGGGDVLLAAAIGTLLGPGRLFWTFFLFSIMGGALVGVALLATRRLGRRDAMAFGPYMVVAAVLVLLWPELSDTVAGWYGLGPVVGDLTRGLGSR